MGYTFACGETTVEYSLLAASEIFGSQVFMELLSLFLGRAHSPLVLTDMLITEKVAFLFALATPPRDTIRGYSRHVMGHL